MEILEVTYQELLDDLYLDKTTTFKDDDIEKVLLGSHEISPECFEEFKDRYWEGRRTVYLGILKFSEVAMLYFENDYNQYEYFEIDFTRDFKGKTFTLGMKTDHHFEDGLSRYPSKLFKTIVSNSSEVWVVKGNKCVDKIKYPKYPNGYYDIMMLKCKNKPEIKEKTKKEFTFYDIVEDPNTKMNDIFNYKKNRNCSNTI